MITFFFYNCYLSTFILDHCTLHTHYHIMDPYVLDFKTFPLHLSLDNVEEWLMNEFRKTLDLTSICSTENPFDLLASFTKKVIRTLQDEMDSIVTATQIIYLPLPEFYNAFHSLLNKGDTSAVISAFGDYCSTCQGRDPAQMNADDLFNTFLGYSTVFYSGRREILNVLDHAFERLFFPERFRGSGKKE